MGTSIKSKVLQTSSIVGMVESFEAGVEEDCDCCPEEIFDFSSFSFFLRPRFEVE
jgi:hypothetical protein